MKNTILIIVLTLTFSASCFSQNALYLKNGDKMSGKLEGYKNDTILFNFQGNKLKFNTADVVSVYFDDKVASNNQIKTTGASNDQEKTTIVPEINPSKMGKISGVVNYLLRYEFKPDEGADVYFADSTNLKDFNFATIDSFSNFVVYKNYTRTWKPRPSNILIASIYDEGEKYNDNKVNFKLLDKRASMNISRIVNDRNSTKAVVDRKGNYSVKILPGSYYVLFKSRNSSRFDKFETSEPFKCIKVNINEGESITMNYDFGFEYK